MYCIYHLEHPFFEQFKIQAEPWPWQKDPAEWNTVLKKSLAMVAFNNIFTLPFMIFLNIYFNNYEVMMSFEIEKLPDAKTLFTNIVFMMLLEDLGLHCAHKFFHIKWIYPYFHKMHHNYHTPVSVCGEYLHPIDFAVGSVIPAGIGAMILGKRLHFFTFLVYGIVRVGETGDAHSGYEFPWSPWRILPFSTSA